MVWIDKGEFPHELLRGLQEAAIQEPTGVPIDPEEFAQGRVGACAGEVLPPSQISRPPGGCFSQGRPNASGQEVFSSLPQCVAGLPPPFAGERGRVEFLTDELRRPLIGLGWRRAGVWRKEEEG